MNIWRSVSRCSTYSLLFAISFLIPSPIVFVAEPAPDPVETPKSAPIQPPTDTQSDKGPDTKKKPAFFL